MGVVVFYALILKDLNSVMMYLWALKDGQLFVTKPVSLK